MQDHDLGASRSWLALCAVVLLVLLFVASRVGILSASLDRNSNWEEPVFLFSATELARDGLSGLFDYQDLLEYSGTWVQSMTHSIQYNPFADMDGNGTVDENDLLLWLEGLGDQ